MIGGQGTKLQQHQEELLAQGMRLTIEDMAFRGEALARADGQVVFVPYVMPGEEAVVRLVRQRKGYSIGRALEIVKPSPYRVAPPCPHFGVCTGCNWQHIAYEHQLALKQKIVSDQLRRLGKFTDPPVAATIGAKEPWHYRNHARFTVDALGRLGYVQKGSRRFIPIASCLIMAPGIDRLFQQLKGEIIHSTQLNIRYGVNTDRFLVQPQLPDAGIPCETGQLAYEEELLGHRFRISAASFFQVNTHQAAVLVATVRQRLELQGDAFLVDAYAGVGTFGVLFAPLVRRVLCIEEAAPAMADFQVNAQGIANIEFLRGKAEEVLSTLVERPQAVILDPPRIGCHPKALGALLRFVPPRVVYVSCDPATLARDLRILCDGGYDLVSVQPLDMFPQTYHVESVATLVRRG